MLRFLCTTLIVSWNLFAGYRGVALEDRAEVLRSAAALIEARDYDKAESVLHERLTTDPDDALALNLLGILRMQQQRPGEAEKLFQRSIDTGHQAAGPHVNLAKLHALDQPLEAIRQLGDALRIAPGDVQASVLLREISRQAAAIAMRRRDGHEALQIALAARDAKPHDPDLLYLFGMVASDGGFNSDAENSLAEALRLKPDFHDAEYALARVYLAENKAAPAEKLMRQYLASRPSDATAEYGLGYILTAEQKLEEAKSAYRRSLELQPAQTESSFELGSIAQQQGDSETARRCFEKVLQRDPNHAGALTGMAIIEFRLSQYEKARSRLERAIAAAPKYQKAHYYCALVLSKLGNRADAAREFDISRSLEKTQSQRATLAVIPQ